MDIDSEINTIDITCYEVKIIKELEKEYNEIKQTIIQEILLELQKYLK
jgi:hypothetical protein